MARPKISVVLACFNNPEHLESSLCSVLDQGYENLQLIVVDGSEQDQTTSELRHYRQSLDLWMRQRCTTLSQTINAGLSRVEGDIVAVLEAGDLYLPGTLESVAQNMQDNTPWLVGSCQRIDENDCRLGTCMASRPASMVSFLKHDTGSLPLASSFFSREMIQSIGQLDESLSIAFGYDLSARLVAAGHQPKVIIQVLAARREVAVLLAPAKALVQGREYIQVALKHADTLQGEQRKDLILNCDHRARIYALAEAEISSAITPSQAVRSLIETQAQADPAVINRFLGNPKYTRPASMRKAV